MEKQALPTQFVLSKLDLTWHDVLWGFKEGWLDASGVVEFAIHRILLRKEASDLELELAGLKKHELARVPVILDDLKAIAMTSNGMSPKRKWLVLTLAWFYKERENVRDPLGLVEELYAEFGYPKEIESFVRYMPSEDGAVQSQSKEKNEAMLFECWKNFLDLNLT